MAFDSIVAYVILFTVGLSAIVGIGVYYKSYVFEATTSLDARQDLLSEQSLSDIEILSVDYLPPSPRNLTISSKADFANGIYNQTNETTYNDALFLNKQPANIGEAGSLSIQNFEWQLVPFTRTYQSNPVVITTTASDNANDQNAVIPTVRSVNTTHFEVSLCKDIGLSTCDTTTVLETLHYYVFDVDEVAKLSWIDAGWTTIQPNGGSNVVNWGKTFSTIPYVFASANTYNQVPGDLGAMIWVDAITTSGATKFIGCTHQGTADACDGGTPSETFAYVAIDPSANEIIGFSSGAQDIGNSAWTPIAFGQTYTNPIMMVLQNDDDGGQDPEYPAAKGIIGTAAEIRYCEQDGPGVCNSHTGEWVMWGASEAGNVKIPDQYYENGTWISEIFDMGLAADFDQIHFNVTAKATVEDAASLFKLEWGNVTVNNEDWTTINFQNTYKKPIVVASVEYMRALPVTQQPRPAIVNNITTTTFQVKVDEHGMGATVPTTFSGTTIVHYMVMEEGVWNMPGTAVTVEAGEVSTTKVGYRSAAWTQGVNCENVNYGGTYTSSNPVVLHTRTSVNNPDPDTGWAASSVLAQSGTAAAGNTGMCIGLNRGALASAGSITNPETLHYIVIDEPFNGVINGKEWESGMWLGWSNGWDNFADPNPPQQAWSHAWSVAPQVILAAGTGIAGSDGYHSVLYAPDITNFKAFTDEQYSAGSRVHASESVGAFAFQGTDNYVGSSGPPGGPDVSTAPTDVLVQIRSSPTLVGLTGPFLGPDNTTSTYYNETALMSEIHDSDQYIQLYVLLNTSDTTVTPYVYDFIISYEYLYGDVSIIVKNDGDLIISDEIITVYINNTRIPRNENNFMTELLEATNYFNPLQWDSLEELNVTFPYNLSTGKHLIKVVNEFSVADHMVLEL